MLANFFDKTKPINNIVLVIVFFSFFTIYIFHQEQAYFTEFSRLYRLGYLFTSGIFLFICALVFMKNGVSNGNLHNSFIMILLYGMFPSAFDINISLAIALLFLFIYRSISQLNSGENAQLLLFNSGILTGISVLIYDWSIFILVFIYMGLFFSKKINLRNLISPILGFSSPLLLFFTYSFFVDHVDLFFHKFSFVNTLNFSFYQNSFIKTPLLIISLITSISIFVILPKIISINNAYRFQFQLIIIMLIIDILLVTMTTEKNGSELLYLFTPVSIILGKFLAKIQKQNIKEIFIGSLTLISVIVLLFHS